MDSKRADAVLARRPSSPDTLTSGHSSPDSIGIDSVFVHSVRADSMAAKALVNQFHMVDREASQRGKLPALSETGYEGIPDSTWWTDRVLPTLTADSATRNLAYMLVWRNGRVCRIPRHHVAPYPGHGSAKDFVDFYEPSRTVFEDGIADLYR